jgi:hypothetical protein
MREVRGSNPGYDEGFLYAPTTPVGDGLHGDTVKMPPPEPSPEQWHIPEPGEPSVSAELEEHQTIRFPEGREYDTHLARDDVRHPDVQQRLVGMIQAGDTHLAIIAVGNPRRPQLARYILARTPDAQTSTRATTFLAQIPDSTTGEPPLVVGRSLPGLANAPDTMSGQHFSAITRDGQVEVTNIGGKSGENATEVFAPNTESTAQKRKEAWGSQWHMSGVEAAQHRPSEMRDAPERGGHVVTFETIELGHEHDQTEFDFNSRQPLATRGDMRQEYGLDAAQLASFVLAPTTRERAETIHLLDRGSIPYEDWWALYDGGPSMGSRQRYVLVDQGFMEAAYRAQQSRDPSILRQYAAETGGLYAIDSAAGGNTLIGRSNWGERFGPAAGQRVWDNSVVSSIHMRISFDNTTQPGFHITEAQGGSTNGTSVVVNQNIAPPVAPPTYEDPS